MAFALKLDYFKTFKEVEGGFLDDSDEHEVGECRANQTRSVRKLLKAGFYQIFEFSRQRPWWEYETGSLQVRDGCIGDRGRVCNFGLVQRSFISRASARSRRSNYKKRPQDVIIVQ